MVILCFDPLIIARQEPRAHSIIFLQINGWAVKACTSLLNMKAVCQNLGDHNLATSPAKLPSSSGEI
jgi:hypothetical protein